MYLIMFNTAVKFICATVEMFADVFLKIQLVIISENAAKLGEIMTIVVAY